MANILLRFIPNEGQAGLEAEYHVQAAGHTVLFDEEKVVLRREESIDKKNEIVLEFKGANKNPIIEGNEKLPGVANFYKGSEPTKWQTNLPTYSTIIYEELYPGIDMAYIGEDGKLESEFYVSPGADHNQIKLNYKGIISKRIRGDGALLLETELGDLIEKAPYAYQDIDGVREEVEAEYTLLADASIGFELGQYNRDFLVVIDPELVFMNFIDHSSGGWTSAVAFDNVGNLVFAGASNRFFPATDVIDSSNHEGGSSDDGLLLKVDAATGEIIYSALFGGGKQDSFNDIAIDDLGNIYLVGITKSNNFPVLNALQDTIGGSHDAFLSILNSNGELTYSTYLGGSRTDWALDVALDGSGNIFMAGRTVSPDFPVKNAFQDTIKGEEKYGDYNEDIFLAKVNSTGDLSYATYLGGSTSDRVEGIAVNNSGELTITGSTGSHDFPLINAYQESNTTLLNWESTMFITRLNSTGNGLIFSTYFGDAGNDWASGIDVVANGEAYISGGTTSEDFPIIGGESFPEADSSDGVLIRLDNSGQPIFSLRSNVAGSEYFDKMARQNDSTLLFMSKDNDSLRIYEKKDDTLFEEIFSFHSEGHNINDIEYGDGSLAFASTYWGTGLGKITSTKERSSIVQGPSFARVAFGLLRILELFDTQLIDGKLSIRIKKANFDGLKVGVDQDGNVTINGVSTAIKAADAKEIEVTGSDGADDIDLSEVIIEKFPNMDDSDVVVFVNAQGGDDKVQGADDMPNEILGGKGDDELQGGKKSDVIHGEDGNDQIFGHDGDDKVRGGKGNDRIFGGKGDDSVSGGEDNDELDGGEGDDRIDGDKGKDKLFGGNGRDWLNFDKDDEIVNGEEGSDKYFIEGKKVPPPLNNKNYSSHNVSRKVVLNNIESTVILSDSSGIDTLNFAGYDIGITLKLNSQNSAQTIDTSGIQILLDGEFEVVIGTDYDDEITVSPLPDTARHIDGGDGTDILNFESPVEGSVDDGSTITTPGFADVTYSNFETVNISVVSGVEEADVALPLSYNLSNNYPNPFNPSTKIKYQIPSNVKGETANVELIVFDILGREVATLVNEQQKPGYYEIDFSASHLTSGIYFYRIQAGKFIETKKMVLLR